MEDCWNNTSNLFDCEHFFWLLTRIIYYLRYIPSDSFYSGLKLTTSLVHVPIYTKPIVSSKGLKTINLSKSTDLRIKGDDFQFSSSNLYSSLVFVWLYDFPLSGISECYTCVLE